MLSHCDPSQFGTLLAAEGGAEFEMLKCCHAVKLILTVNCWVEEAGLAVGEVVGYDSLKSASRMNDCYLS